MLHIWSYKRYNLPLPLPIYSELLNSSSERIRIHPMAFQFSILALIPAQLILKLHLPLNLVWPKMVNSLCYPNGEQCNSLNVYFLPILKKCKDQAEYQVCICIATFCVFRSLIQIFLLVWIFADTPSSVFEISCPIFQEALTSFLWACSIMQGWKGVSLQRIVKGGQCLLGTVSCKDSPSTLIAGLKFFLP